MKAHILLCLLCMFDILHNKKSLKYKDKGKKGNH